MRLILFKKSESILSCEADWLLVKFLCGGEAVVLDLISAGFDRGLAESVSCDDGPTKDLLMTV